MKIRISHLAATLALLPLFGLAACANPNTATTQTPSTPAAAPATVPTESIRPAPATPYVPSGYGARRY